MGIVLTSPRLPVVAWQYFWTVVRAGYNVRTAITTSVYRKSLRLSPAARQAASTGEVVNLMQLDAMRLEMFTMQLNVGWDGIYQILGYMALLTYYLGPASFAGLAVMILLMPVQAVVMRKLMQWQQAMVKDTDERVKLTNEVLQGIKVIKLYNWEESFVDTLDTIRTREMRMLRKLALLRAFNAAFMMASPAFVAVTAFAAYSADPDNKPSASVFFTALALFSQLRFPLMFFPMVLASFAQARVRCRPRSCPEWACNMHTTARLTMSRPCRLPWVASTASSTRQRCSSTWTSWTRGARTRSPSRTRPSTGSTPPPAESTATCSPASRFATTTRPTRGAHAQGPARATRRTRRGLSLGGLARSLWRTCMTAPACPPSTA